MSLSDWQESALCAQIDPEEFFPESRSSGYTARKICRMCDVRTECLKYALDHRTNTPDGILYGIWGGYGIDARKKIWSELTDKGEKPVPGLKEINDWLEENGEIQKSGASKW